MIYDPLQAMSDAELLRGLRRVGEPLILELLRRGYDVQLHADVLRVGQAAFTLTPTLSRASP